MRVDAAAADIIPAGCALDLECAPPGQERPHQVQPAADATEQPRVRRVSVQIVGAQRQQAALSAHVDAQPLQNCQHRVNVVDLRDILQGNCLIGEQRCGDEGKGGVLVAADADSSLDPVAALDGK